MSKLDDFEEAERVRLTIKDCISKGIHPPISPDHFRRRNIKFEPHIRHACVGIALTLTDSIRMTMAHLIAEAASHLDDIKRFAPAEDHLKAVVHANKLHGIAQILAGDREHEIYAPDDELAEAECSGITTSP